MRVLLLAGVVVVAGVKAASAGPSTTITDVSGPASVYAGSQVEVDVQVSTSAGYVTTGMVTESLYDGVTLYGSPQTKSFSSSDEIAFDFTAPTIAADYTVQVVYDGTANYVPSIADLTLPVNSAPTAVPEPTSLALLALPLGAAGLIVARRRRDTGAV